VLSFAALLRHLEPAPIPDTHEHDGTIASHLPGQADIIKAEALLAELVILTVVVGQTLHAQPGILVTHQAMVLALLVGRAGYLLVALVVRTADQTLCAVLITGANYALTQFQCAHQLTRTVFAALTLEGLASSLLGATQPGWTASA